MRTVVWVRSHHGRAHTWILWPSWQVWRFGQRAPEEIGFRDIEDVQWREAS